MTNARVTREARQEKAAQLRAQVARQQARRRALLVGGAVLAVIVIAIGIFVFVQNARRTSTAASGGTPGNLGPSNSVVVGAASAPVTLVAYEDFQCPVCKQFEQLNATQIDAWVKAGEVKVEYRPIAFLDRNSTDKYSTRALNAMAALVNSTPSAFPAFHRTLFEQQPAEGGPGLTGQKLIDLAVAAGAPKAPMTSAVNDLAYQGWTKRVTDAASKAGVTGTPTLQVDGKTLADYAPATVKKAVDAALAAAKK